MITVLATIGSSEELSLHTEVGLNHGLTRTEIKEIMMQMTIYGGIPRAVEGYQAMKRAYDKIDARG